MKLFGRQINVGKVLGIVAKVAVPVVIGAVVTNTPIAKALKNAARAELDKAVRKGAG